MSDSHPMPKANAECKVCGTKYYICKRCIELRGKGVYTWKLDACSEDCFRLYMIIDDYRHGRASRSKTRELLGASGYQKIAFVDQMSPIIEDIFYENNVVVEAHAGEGTKAQVLEEPQMRERRRKSKNPGNNTETVSPDGGDLKQSTQAT